MSEHQKWRNYFPRGLKQPQKGFRFSIDSLLLSCFVAPGSKDRILDLGTGCGVISFGILLLHIDKDIEIIGVDISQELIDMALENAYKLGFNQHFLPIQKNVKEIITSPEFGPEDFDQVICNPPYREYGHGRISPFQDKNQACFTSPACLKDFVAAASYSLKNKGRFLFIFLTQRLVMAISLLQDHHLEPKRIRLVHSSISHPAHLCLIECKKNVNPGLTVDPPLILYQGKSSQRNLSEEILSFCPFLRCNA